MEKENKQKNIPEHVGIIMDGNRRWARERNLPTLEGHLRGYNKLRTIPEQFFLQGVKIVSVFAFSTENWNRSREEVNYLMKLIKKAFQEDMEHFVEKKIKVLLSGRIEELPGDLPDICAEIVEKTQGGTEGIINICLNYGGRAEIVDAVKKIVKNKVSLEQVHEGIIRKYLYQSDIPDPDIIVRTSGEHRLSGFLLWQGAYSEIMFMKKYWPEFEKSDVDIVLEEYANRNRRFGGN
jgi:undecaprenyl diphosphate synthase